jgi:molecular chaperone DnaK (HSP70)
VLIITVQSAQLIHPGIPNSQGQLWIQFETMITQGLVSTQSSTLQVWEAVLSQVKTEAEDLLGYSISEVFISVPGHFNSSMRQSVKDGGKRAGFFVRVAMLQHDAAPIAHQLEQLLHGERYHAVVNYNQASLDMAVVNVDMGTSETRTFSTNPHYGERAVDFNLAQLLIDKSTTLLLKEGIKANSSAIDLLADKIHLLRTHKRFHTPTPLSVVISNFHGDQDLYEIIDLEDVRRMEESQAAHVERMIYSFLESSTLQRGLSEGSVNIPFRDQISSIIFIGDAVYRSFNTIKNLMSENRAFAEYTGMSIYTNDTSRIAAKGSALSARTVIKNALKIQGSLVAEYPHDELWNYTTLASF